MTEGTPRILLIDEVTDDREIYGKGLAMLGYAVTVADPGEAFAAARRPQPDLVVLHLSRGENWEMCDELRRLYGLVPVVVLTADVRPDGSNRRRARATANCAGFLGKPCTHLELGGVIARILAGERGIEATTGRAAR